MYRIIALLVFIWSISTVAAQVKMKVLSRREGKLYINGKYKNSVKDGDVMVYKLSVSDKYTLQLLSSRGYYTRTIYLEKNQQSLIGEIGGGDLTKFRDPRDGNIYPVVKIGNDWWMAENMRYELEGSKINPDNPTKAYGRLYTWEQAREACPAGWHLSTRKEWAHLEYNMGIPEEDISSMVKEDRQFSRSMKLMKDWSKKEDRVFNSHFNVLPAGTGFMNTFDGLGKDAVFWTRGRFEKNLGLVYRFKTEDLVIVDQLATFSFASCRCVKNR